MFDPTWEPEIATIIAQKYKELNQNIKRPIMAAVVGMPGSLKTTSSDILASILETEHGIPCVVLPMDGYHYSMAQLKSMPNPQEFIYRRGAPDTFDAQTLKSDLEKVCHGTEDVEIQYINVEYVNNES